MNGHAQNIRLKAALGEAFTRDAVLARRAPVFRACARWLFLAHARGADSETVEPLQALPHGVLVFILDLARPDGFPAIV